MELVLFDDLIEIAECDLIDIEAGTFWGVVGGACTVVGGVAGVVGGVALILVPEPTTATKFAGWGAASAGVAAIGGGAAQIASNW